MGDPSESLQTFQGLSAWWIWTCSKIDCGGLKIPVLGLSWQLGRLLLHKEVTKSPQGLDLGIYEMGIISDL